MTDAAPRESTATRLRFVAPPSLESAPEVTTKIGRYEILETLGKGAMGVVYKARDPLLDRIVAVKTIVAPRGGGKRARQAYLERFKREAKAAAKMQHPSIVTIFDVGVDEDSGAPFMVLEYLPGDSLADRLDHYRMRLGRAVQVGLDLASALAFAHRKRIVHRDVKPANVLHAGDNRWKLADFGIARLPDSELTQVGIFMGTPGYAPPEAIREGFYTPQADVFAWGAVLYELLSGKIPYEGPDTKTTNKYVVQGLARTPRAWDPSIPEPLAQVTMQALHSDPSKRFKSADEAEEALKDAWERCLEDGLVSASAMSGRDVPHSEVEGKGVHGKAPKFESSVGERVQPGPPPDPAERKPPEATEPDFRDMSSISDDEPTRLVPYSPNDSSEDPTSPPSLPAAARMPHVPVPRPLGSSPVFRRPTSSFQSSHGLWIAVAVLGLVAIALIFVLLKMN